MRGVVIADVYLPSGFCVFIPSAEEPNDIRVLHTTSTLAFLYEML